MALWTEPTHHRYTPWIVINGKANPSEASSNLLAYTCNLYESQGSECTNNACARYRNEGYQSVCYKDS